MKQQNKKPIHTLKSTFVIIKAEGSPEFINQALKGVTKALKEKSGCNVTLPPSAQGRPSGERQSPLQHGGEIV